MPGLTHATMDKKNETPGGFVWDKSELYYASKETRLAGHKIGERDNIRTVTQCAMICYRFVNTLSTFIIAYT